MIFFELLQLVYMCCHEASYNLKIFGNVIHIGSLQAVSLYSPQVFSLRD